MQMQPPNNQIFHIFTCNEIKNNVFFACVFYNTLWNQLDAGPLDCLVAIFE